MKIHPSYQWQKLKDILLCDMADSIKGTMFKLLAVYPDFLGVDREHKWEIVVCNVRQGRKGRRVFRICFFKQNFGDYLFLLISSVLNFSFCPFFINDAVSVALQLHYIPYS